MQSILFINNGKVFCMMDKNPYCAGVAQRCMAQYPLWVLANAILLTLEKVSCGVKAMLTLYY
jgi:hypothetical protein